MRKIKQDELFHSLNEFLKGKGIELKEGPYAQRIHNACNLLAETVNTTQSTARRAVNKVDKKLNQVRQCIHDATAPKGSKAAAPKPAPFPAPKTKRPRASGKKSAPSPGRKIKK